MTKDRYELRTETEQIVTSVGEWSGVMVVALRRRTPHDTRWVEVFRENVESERRFVNVVSVRRINAAIARAREALK